MRVLLITCTAGYRHNYLTTAVEVLTRMGERNGFDVYATEDCSELDKEMKGSSCVLLLTTGEIPLSDQQKDWLVDFVYEGGGFVGVHNAADTLYTFPRYHEMLGGTFNGHPWTGRVRALVEDPAHPSTAHLPPEFETTEEVYTFKDWSRDRTHVLVRLDNSSVDVSKGNRDDADYALSWCHLYGSGRVFYTAFGHFPVTWREEWFQRHLLGGIRWASERPSS
ncbi:ThuA domain-containing protein [Tardisphaera miroshnichenkoae]